MKSFEKLPIVLIFSDFFRFSCTDPYGVYKKYVFLKCLNEWILTERFKLCYNDHGYNINFVTIKQTFLKTFGLKWIQLLNKSEGL